MLSCARRMLRFDFDVFFFGTAIFLSLFRSPCARPDCLDNMARRIKRLYTEAMLSGWNLSVQLVLQRSQRGEGRSFLVCFSGPVVVIIKNFDIGQPFLTRIRVNLK